MNMTNHIAEYIDKVTDCTFASHYFYYYSTDEKHFAIRMPGSTVGCIYLDDNNIITKIRLGGGLFTYEEEIVKHINDRFVGTKYPFDEDTRFMPHRIRYKRHENIRSVLFMLILFNLMKPLSEDNTNIIGES